MHTPRRLGPLPAILVTGLLALLVQAPASRAQPAGDRVLRLSLPHVNTFYLQPAGEPDAKVNTGFWGVGVGLLFRHSRSQYLGLATSAATDLPVPVPAAIDFEGEHEFLTNLAIDLTNNHTRGRFTLGYGVSYGANRWKLDNDQDPVATMTRAPVTVRHNFLGLVFPAYYSLNERFALGLIYRPALYRFGTEPGFCYEHVISIDFSWNLKLP